ncbi:HlyD family efflux transporter periplasmic adaptor subunit [Bacillus anthracis]|uniref:HlyD family efflux transporter periplasmic adaptor subunit n=1 Tax=Bacillus cereus group TaxID=86661 RepID=UPI0023627623|nr:HlyD family efflux transporter periplasmic adaptor subunit [Bacillus cereus]MDD0822232.1 HlyD family efflux transporter periplasmic adaptor subunit [Bacillus cereus]UBR29936.1 HlyD family efflux transporter periplasmic adaptor subunit [Bacillus sp. SD-4]
MNRIYDFEELTDSVELLNRKPPRFIIWFLIFLFGSLAISLFWICTGEINIVNSGTAIVKNKSETSIIRSQNDGIIEGIVITNGDFVKKGDLLFRFKSNKSEEIEVKAKAEGIVQFSDTIQDGDIFKIGQEILSIVPKDSAKYAQLTLLAKDIKDIKLGDKVNYSFNSDTTNEELGTVTYIAAQPIFDKDLKEYVYRLEATMDFKEAQELPTGISGKVSIITGSKPIWKSLLKF